jgi:hypothetical protein
MADDELVFEDDVSEPATVANTSNGNDTKEQMNNHSTSNGVNGKRKHDDNDTSTATAAANGSNGNGVAAVDEGEDDDEEEEEEEEEEAEPFQPVTDGRDVNHASLLVPSRSLIDDNDGLGGMGS